MIISTMIRTTVGAIVAVAATGVCAQEPTIGGKRAAVQATSPSTFESMPIGNIRIRGTDLLVGWPKLIGKRVRVKGGRVFLATLTSSNLQVKGGQITLAPPWSNRERLQYVMNNC